MANKLTKEDKKRLIKGTLPIPFGENLLELLDDGEFRKALSNFHTRCEIDMKVEANICIRFLNELERRYMQSE